MRSLAFLLSTGALVACIPGLSVHTTQLNPPPRELRMRAPSTVEVYTTQRPSRAYMEYASLELRGYGEERARMDMFRNRGGELGCDALVVLAYVNGIPVKATCVVYGAGAGPGAAGSASPPGTQL